MGEVYSLQNAAATPEGYTHKKYARFPEEKQLPPEIDTFYKRVNFFRYDRETDKEFATRLGVSLSCFYRWKNKGKRPSLTNSYIRLGEVLNVCPLWLMSGAETAISIFPSGLRLISIPRGFYFIETFVEPYHRQREAS